MLISKLIKKYQHFSGSDKSRMLFFLLINVKMPTIVVGILTFMSRKNFMFTNARMNGRKTRSLFYKATFLTEGGSLNSCM